MEAAVRAFTQDGPYVTLEAIAREAGVGIGTLYRHFPTRYALVEATCRDEMALLCEAAGQLLATLPPEAAMRAWMDRFVDCMAARGGMADALRALMASGGRGGRHHARSMEGLAGLTSAISALLDAGSAAGTVRQDVVPEDVLTSLSGVSLAAGEPAQREGARRVLDLLMDGLRHGAPGAR
ncbi:TetR/AcrR family transcriptional regulator [Streptomyces ovatisporus]|uniref:TetR/AcrR family transcriptional regulator n=1 Tax=Streptomyces ovatisporus TaxID=1128682 RepID=A0ABV9A9C9_9ACTN